MPPGLVAFPTELREIVGSGRKYVGTVVPDIAVPFAFEIDRIVQIARRHELALPHRTRPGTAHRVEIDEPAIEDAKCGDQFAPEIGAAASVIGKRCERR